MMVTYIVPTVGRPTLARALDSCETVPGDEIVIVADQSLHADLMQHVVRRPRGQVRLLHCPPGADWGHTERNHAMPLARGQYVAHIDDDDFYIAGTRGVMEDAMRKAAGKPVLFRMQYPNGITLWQDKVVRCGNVGTPMFLIPNRPTMLGAWGSFVGGDCHFLETSKWSLADDYVWRDEVIAHLGHN